MEFSKKLSSKHHVTLLAQNIEKDFSIKGIDLVKYNNVNLFKAFRKADIIICQPTKILAMILGKLLNKKLIIDLYDPILLEYLEMYKGKKDLKSFLRMKYGKTKLKVALSIGDVFMCASEKQKSYWHGCLSLIGRINNKTYKNDVELNKLLFIVPFGLQEAKDELTPYNYSEFNSVINENDKILIWGGGIWNWFDPLTLIKAVNEVIKINNNVKLFFMGAGHPDPKVPKMKKYNEAKKMAEDLDLLDKYVFFNNVWVPYNNRFSYLNAAYIGVSTHYNTIETEYSFRTRILDYLWSELPVISTKGDYFAEYITDQKIGLAVEAENISDLKNAILEIVQNEQLYNEMKKNLTIAKKEFEWGQVTIPLLNYCSNPYYAADNKTKVGIILSAIKSLL
ncbi:glycosyltransferase [Niallia sp.]|uniref:glycosyltransferase n=1 Tax=Niallia sp. TaxID=2837523 RepID=UPI00289953F6|nr:glycosyltransferase [Niallia sp.]